MSFEKKYSVTVQRIKSNIIRELLKTATQEGIISFGGGIPDPETFPIKKIADISNEVITNEYKIALQYGSTEGDPELLKQYIKLLEKHEGITGLTEQNLMITTGSQQALYIIGTVFLDEDSYCAVSKPIYLGAGSAFNQRNPNYISIPLEKDGMNIDVLEEELKKLEKEGKIDKFKFVYTVSNFHNPAGVSLSLEKRKRLIELAEKYDFIIIEDDPYGALRFEGEKQPSIFKLNNGERVVMLNTFSKVLSPGLRIGVIVGNKELIRKMVLAKQGMDLCSAALTQRIAARFIEKYDLFEEIKPTIEIYKQKKDKFMEALDKYLGDIEGIDWVKPEGGLFSWITLPEGFDTMEMFEIAKEKKIIYIPGETFYVDNPDRNTMRVSFCLPSFEELEEGTRRLRETIEEYAKRKGIMLKTK
ncbi:PLP-dependent aminotransferase family protein [Marinitoga sp. 38H-ov]|uniref:aminotransferase-like domain-containing protein n=1 Tax=Marinitoga sp. 38H-ov TaxID=1755814 RepID=UPI0013ED5CD3|nr:PLP-dependent aminotransferase family protein [Marinitoga sp. 38H-ov]KAF2956367.1 aspartate aminotransferase [Marinitoga sp. 38H-ov]